MHLAHHYLPTVATFRLPAARLLALAALLGAAALPGDARAQSNQTFTWDGGLSHGNATGDNLWSTANNWVGGAAAVSGTDSANLPNLVFTRSGGQTTAAQNVANPFQLNSLTFDASSNVTALTGSALSFIRPFIITAGSLSITQNSATNVTVGNDLPIASGNTLSANVNGSGTLTLAGFISGGDVTFGNRANLSKGGTGTLILNGNNSYSGNTVVSQGVLRVDSTGAINFGSGGLITFPGNGTLQFTANNTVDYSSALAFSGNQSIRVDTNGQNVNFGSGITGAGTGITKLGAGTLTISNQGIFGDDSRSNDFTGPSSVLAGTLFLNKDAGLHAIGGDLSIGNASSPGAAGSVVARLGNSGQTANNTSVSVFRDGLFDLAGNATRINGLTMTGGEVRIGAGTLTVGGDVTVNASAEGSRITSGNLSDNVNLNGGTRTFTVARGTGTYDLDVPAGVANGTLTKAGPGVLRLAGSTNTGLGVTLNAGTLAVANDNALGNGGTFTLAGGTVVADGGNHTVSNPVNVTGNFAIGAGLDGTPQQFTLGGTMTVTNSATLTVANFDGTGLGSVVLGANTLTLAGGGPLAIFGNVTGTGALNKTGSNVLTLVGTGSTFSGGLTVSSGSVNAKNGGSLGASGNLVTLLNGSPLAFTDAAVSVGQTFNLNTGTLAPAAGGTITYDAATVNNGALGAGSHVLGNGTRLDGVRIATGAAVAQTSGTATLNNVLFTGTSTFTQGSGATLRTTGDLTANPQTSFTVGGTVNTPGGSFTGAVTVNNGGVLANSAAPLYLDGSRGATINAGGRLTAASGSTVELGGLLVNNGMQTGVLNVNLGGLAKGSGSFGTVNVGNGGKFSPGNSPGAATAAAFTLGAGSRYDFELNNTTADLLNVSGTLTLSAGTTAGTRFVVGLFTLDQSNNPAMLTTFDASQPRTFLLATAAGGIVGFDPAEASVDATGFRNDLAGGSFSVLQQGNNLVVLFSPVPEPGTWVLLGVGGALGGVLRRRRRRQG